MSFRLFSDISEIKECITNLNRQHVVCVAGAGNDGNNKEPGYPALYENVLSVGAVNVFGVISDFSTRHRRRIDVYTLGENVLAANSPKSGLDADDPLIENSRKFECRSGTSFATPAVSGLIAIIVQCAREQGGEELAQQITSTDTLRKLLKKHLLSELTDQQEGTAYLIQPENLETFFQHDINDLHQVIQDLDKPKQYPPKKLEAQQTKQPASSSEQMTSHVANNQQETLQDDDSKQDTPQVTDDQQDTLQVTDGQQDTLQVTDGQQDTLQVANDKQETPQVTDSEQDIPQDPGSEQDTPQVTDSEQDISQDPGSEQDTPQVTDSEQDISQDPGSEQDTPRVTDSEQDARQVTDNDSWQGTPQVAGSEQDTLDPQPQVTNGEQEAFQKINGEQNNLVKGKVQPLGCEDNDLTCLVFSVIIFSFYILIKLWSGELLTFSLGEIIFSFTLCYLVTNILLILACKCNEYNLFEFVSLY